MNATYFLILENRKSTVAPSFAQSSIPFPVIDGKHAYHNHRPSIHHSIHSSKIVTHEDRPVEEPIVMPSFDSLPEIPDEDEEIHSVRVSPADRKRLVASKKPTQRPVKKVMPSQRPDSASSQPSGLPLTLHDMRRTARKLSSVPGLKLSSLAQSRIPPTIPEYSSLSYSQPTWVHGQSIPFPKAEDSVPRSQKAFRCGTENEPVLIGDFGEVHQPPSGVKTRMAKAKAVSRSFGKDRTALLNRSSN